MIIHACHYSSQPYVQILCTQRHHYVGFQPPGMPDGVHMADHDVEGEPPPLYTFREALVTCPDCLDRYGDAT